MILNKTYMTAFIALTSFVAILGLSQTSNAYATRSYDFKELAVKDYEEMEEIVRRELGPESVNDPRREQKVRRAMRVVLSRPDNDGRRGDLFGQLLGKLEEGMTMVAVSKLTNEVIAEIQNKKLEKNKRATSYLVLENLMAELKSRKNDYKDIFERIKNANIEIDSELKGYRRLEGMMSNSSPSEIAKDILGG